MKLSTFIKSNFLLLSLIILLIAFVLRFYKLGDVPSGLYRDETAIGYNAYSIIETGKDEYGKQFPLYFKSFGDYKLPIYIYSTVPAIEIFGMTPFAVRLPSALFGFLTVPLLGLLVYELTKDKRLALVSMLFLAINPWHIHYNRATFEVSISLFLFVLGTYLLHRSFNSTKKGLFILGTLSFIAGLYTYNLTRLLAPLLYILILIFFKGKTKHVTKAEYALTAIVSILLLLPFALTYLSPGGASSASGTLIFSSAAVQAPLLEFRSYLVNFPSIFTSVLFNKLALTLWQYINNIFSYLSVQFFFITGPMHGNHGIGNVGLFYIPEIITITYGVFTVVTKKLKWGLFLLSFGALTILVAALTRESPQATRSFFLIIPLITLSALGAIELFKMVQSKKNTILKLALVVFVVLFAYNMVFYLSSYYVRFPVLYADKWQEQDRNLSEYIENEEKNYDHIIFDKAAGFSYTSYLFYTSFPPEKFQKEVLRLPDDSEGFSEVESFGKFEFKDIDAEEDNIKTKSLIITTPERVPEGGEIVKTFEYPTRPVVISKGQEILQYPATDTPYVVVKTASE